MKLSFPSASDELDPNELLHDFNSPHCGLESLGRMEIVSKSMPHYWRNDRKELLCFPFCRLHGDYYRARINNKAHVRGVRTEGPCRAEIAAVIKPPDLQACGLVKNDLLAYLIIGQADAFLFGSLSRGRVLATSQLVRPNAYCGTVDFEDDKTIRLSFHPKSWIYHTQLPKKRRRLEYDLPPGHVFAIVLLARCNEEEGNVKVEQLDGPATGIAVQHKESLSNLAARGPFTKEVADNLTASPYSASKLRICAVAVSKQFHVESVKTLSRRLMHCNRWKQECLPTMGTSILRALCTLSDTVVYFSKVDKDGQSKLARSAAVSWISDSCQTLWGYEPSELIGENAPSMLGGDMESQSNLEIGEFAIDVIRRMSKLGEVITMSRVSHFDAEHFAMVEIETVRQPPLQDLNKRALKVENLLKATSKAMSSLLCGMDSLMLLAHGPMNLSCLAIHNDVSALQYKLDELCRNLPDCLEQVPSQELYEQLERRVARKIHRRTEKRMAGHKTCEKLTPTKTRVEETSSQLSRSAVRPNDPETYGADLKSHATDQGARTTDLGAHATDLGAHATDLGAHATDLEAHERNPDDASATFPDAHATNHATIATQNSTGEWRVLGDEEERTTQASKGKPAACEMHGKSTATWSPESITSMSSIRSQSPTGVVVKSERSTSDGDKSGGSSSTRTTGKQGGTPSTTKTGGSSSDARYLEELEFALSPSVAEKEHALVDEALRCASEGETAFAESQEERKVVSEDSTDALILQPFSSTDSGVSEESGGTGKTVELPKRELVLKNSNTEDILGFRNERHWMQYTQRQDVHVPVPDVGSFGAFPKRSVVSLVDLIGDRLFLVLSRESHLLWFNAGMCNLFDYEKDEVLFTKNWHMIHPDDAKTLKVSICTQEGCYSAVYRRRSKSGAYLWVEGDWFTFHDVEYSVVVERVVHNPIQVAQSRALRVVSFATKLLDCTQVALNRLKEPLCKCEICLDVPEELNLAFCEASIEKNIKLLESNLEEVKRVVEMRDLDDEGTSEG